MKSESFAHGCGKITRFGLSLDPDRRGTEHPPRVVRANAEERKGARAMTMKERLKVHADIERQNREHFREWKAKQEGGNADDMGTDEV